MKKAYEIRDSIFVGKRTLFRPRAAVIPFLLLLCYSSRVVLFIFFLKLIKYSIKSKLFALTNS